MNYRKSLKSFWDRYPRFYLNFVKKPRAKYFQYADERNLIKGKLKPQSDAGSFVFFTSHKCASMFLKSLFAKLLAKKNLKHVNLDGYLSIVEPKFREVFFDEDFQNTIYHPQGFYYGPFRAFRPIPKTDQYKKILLLRDPRDVLTSYYFSVVFSHTMISENLIDLREKNQDTDINDFVRERSFVFKEVYENYRKQLLDQPNLLFVSYEQMVLDYEGWLKKVMAFLEIDDEQMFADLVAESKFNQKGEGKHSHKRNVMPGDHLNKLNKETIAYLNELFKPELESFGYALD